MGRWTKLRGYPKTLRRGDPWVYHIHAQREYDERTRKHVFRSEESARPKGRVSNGSSTKMEISSHLTMKGQRYGGRRSEE